MASEKTSIATEDALLNAATVGLPLATHSAPHPPASESLAYDPSRAKSLKRFRETTPTSPTSDAAAEQPGAIGSPTKAARFALATSRPSVSLTGAAALEDQRRQREQEEHRLSPPGSSENPNQTVLSALAGHATSAMSRPADAPPQAPTASMDISSKLPPVVSIPPTNHSAPIDAAETSPQSATSGASMGGALVTASPTPMDVDPSLNDQVTPTPQSNSDDKAVAGSMSYPGPLHAGGMQAPPTPHRNMSFPMPSPGQDSQTQSGCKKHKCPYCDTEFTRHHNLKSHLLTHSQEKPFVCSQCDAKFRRLHDLKRHSKLHTGEKNHICPKCHRKFARGDALARHSKGPGGCAGRRSSMGAFADGDGLDGSMHEGDESMTGVVYPGDESMTEEERRQLSLPSIKASHVSGAPSSSDSYGSQSRTYPPAGSLERPPGGLYPPPLSQERPATGAHVNNSLGGHTTNTSVSSLPSVGGSAIYSQGAGMTESPKPLSPSAAHDPGSVTRQRSPSLTQQFQQHHFGRRLSGRQSPPAYPPGSTQSGGAAQQSGSSHPGGASENSNMFSTESAMWTYFQGLEEHVKQLSDTISTMQKADSAKQAQVSLLTTDVTALKRQLQAQEAEVAAKQSLISDLTNQVAELRSQLQVRPAEVS